MIASLSLELNEARSAKEECENRLEFSEEALCAWKEEARKRKAEAARLSCRVRRFGGNPSHTAERVT